jgi:acid phosphatase
MRRFGLVLVLLTLTLTGCAASTNPAVRASGTAQPSTTAPLSTSAAPQEQASPVPASAAVTKVLVFVEENHSLAEMQAGMPYTFGLATQFGYATHYTAIRHPSLPNYVAITGGQTYGITDDASPSVHSLSGASVFGQAIATGKTAAVYADGMPTNCALADGGTNYAVKHNPWAYFATERAECQKYDVPVTQLDQAITNGALPNVGMVVPNLCNDAHNCPLATADAWFKGWMTKIFAGPDWRSGHLAVVLTADEDDSSANNTVLTAVIHPSQKAHVVTAPLTHYSLTRLYGDVAGAPYLSNAKSAPSMTAAFGLPLG